MNKYTTIITIFILLFGVAILSPDIIEFIICIVILILFLILLNILYVLEEMRGQLKK